MTMTMIRAIAAIGRRGQVGLDGRIPWHDPADIARFWRLVTGHVVLVGVATLEGMRQHYPAAFERLHRDTNCWSAMRGGDPEQALDVVREHVPGHDICIIGGPKTWRAFAPFIQEWTIRRVAYDGPADAWFPFDVLVYPPDYRPFGGPDAV